MPSVGPLTPNLTESQFPKGGFPNVDPVWQEHQTKKQLSSCKSCGEWAEWLIIDLPGIDVEECQKVLLPSLTTTCCWTMSVVLDPAQNGRMRWGLNLWELVKDDTRCVFQVPWSGPAEAGGAAPGLLRLPQHHEGISLLVQFIEWPENILQGAEVRIFEHKLCHRRDLSPISGNFNPAQIPNWLQITQLLHSFITNGDIPMVYYTLYENGYSQSQSHTFSKATPECHSWFVLPRLPWAHTNTIIVSPRIKFYFHSRSFQSFHDFVFIPRFSSFRDF